MLTRAHGKITPVHVERVGKLAGATGTTMDKAFAENIGDTYVQNSLHPKSRRKELVRDYVQLYRQAKLVSYQG
jgi:hypothetical protein